MRRPQFSLKTMLWLMAVLAAFLAGIRWERAQRAADAALARKEFSSIERTEDGSWVEYTLYDDGTFDKESIPSWRVHKSGQPPGTEE